jgi:hypothetical protein
MGWQGARLDTAVERNTVPNRGRGGQGEQE